MAQLRGRGQKIMCYSLAMRSSEHSHGQHSMGEVDAETLASLKRLDGLEQISKNRVQNASTVLVVLSSAAMVYDIDAIREKIKAAYPHAVVFFWNTAGESMGAKAPSSVDVVIDLTPPRARQGLFFARKIRRRGKFVVGRNAGFFRKSSYDRVFDEKAAAGKLPMDRFHRERLVQKEVLALAGVSMIETGSPTADLAKVIALELPPMARSR
jgi:hypothetical protein